MITLPNSYNLQQYVPNQTPNRLCQIETYRKDNWCRSNERYVQHLTSPNQFDRTQNWDLRKKLAMKRKQPFVANYQEEDLKKLESRTRKNKWNTQVWEETSIQMNLTPLKMLTSSDLESDQWYIVVDTDIILNNFNYLNNLAAADRDSHLLIPHHVMAELQVHVSESSNVQVKRILRFLTQQIESGLAKLGEEVSGESATHKTITTCVQLASQNNHVVLISDNPNPYYYKLNTNEIHVYTMQDIKDILANRPLTIRPISPTLAIEIAAPNDVIETNVALDEFLESISERNFDSNEFADIDVHYKTNSAENSRQFMENYGICNQSPPKSTVEGNEPAGAGVYSDIHFRENSEADCNICSPTFTVKRKKLDDTGVNTLGVHFVDYSKDDCNQNLSKSDTIGEKVLAYVLGERCALGVGKFKEADILFSSASVRAHVNLHQCRECLNTMILYKRRYKNTVTSQNMKKEGATNIPASDNNIEANVVNVESNADNTYMTTEVMSINKERSTIQPEVNHEALKNAFMYKVDSDMEDVLKIRRDEWVIRFVQIMEEILRVKLQEKGPYNNKQYLAPRNLLDATSNIIKKFNMDFNIVHAANELLYILRKTSNDYGKIAVNIQPSDYMKMYSYGLFLVETFQDLCFNCNEKDCRNKTENKKKQFEVNSCSCYEVNSASESLKRLLYDIKRA